LSIDQSTNKILKKAFNINSINEDQREVLKGIRSYSQYFISGPKNLMAERIALAELAGSNKQSLIIINNIDEMMLLSNKLSEAQVFTTYVHGQLGSEEIRQRVDGFKRSDFRFLFITIEQVLKDDLLFSVTENEKQLNLVVFNAERFAKNNLHHSSSYNYLCQQMNAVEVTISTKTNEPFVFNRLYIGNSISLSNIQNIVKTQRIHNAEYFIAKYAHTATLESMSVKSLSASIRECANICLKVRDKSVILVKDKKQSDLFFNELNKNFKTINAFDYPENNGSQAIHLFNKIQSGVLITGRHAHIAEGKAANIVLSELPLSLPHLSELIDSACIDPKSIQSVYIIYPEFKGINQAESEVRNRFPNLDDHQKVVSFLTNENVKRFDKHLVFKMSKNIPMQAKMVFKVLENLAAMLFVSKNIYFDKGFHANYEVINLNRKLPHEIDALHRDALNELHDLFDMLNAHGCKIQQLNSALGVRNDVKCGKCSVCHQSTVGTSNRWSNRMNSEQQESGTAITARSISKQQSHNLYKNPYVNLDNSTICLTEDTHLFKTTNYKVSSNATNSPIEEKLSLLRSKVAIRLGIPEVSVFNNATLRELIEKNPRSIRELNMIREFYGSLRAQTFGRELLNILNEYNNEK